MRFEANFTADADAKMTPHIALNKIAPNSSVDSFGLFEGDLPDDLHELAAQLSADADRLTELYPARPQREVVVSPGISVVASPWRWMRLAPRVAAAVGVLAGLTLIVGLSSAWRGILAGRPGESPAKAVAPLAVAETGNASTSAAVPAETASAGRPVSISAEALRLSGEEMEILRHATEGAAVEVDI